MRRHKKVFFVTVSFAIRLCRSFGSGAATPSSAGLLQPPASKHAPPPATSSQSQGAVAARYAAYRLCSFYIIATITYWSITVQRHLLIHYKQNEENFKNLTLFCARGQGFIALLRDGGDNILHNCCHCIRFKAGIVLEPKSVYLIFRKDFHCFLIYVRAHYCIRYETISLWCV
jgi:hypothetical protein